MEETGDSVASGARPMRLPGVLVAGRSLLGPGIYHFLAYDTPLVGPTAAAAAAAAEKDGDKLLLSSE